MSSDEILARAAKSMEEAWARWEAPFREQTRAGTELLIREAEIRAGMRVLDVGSGGGEPALAIARAVGTAGSVVASDRAPQAVAALTKTAQALGLTSLSAVVADMASLPLPDEEFDAVTGRLSLMFCPDPEKALTELRRVLKPGGVACFVVWGSPEQPLFATTLGAIEARVPLGLPKPGEPGPFRFTNPDDLRTAMDRAGFVETDARTVILPWPWPGDAESAWSAFYDLSGPAVQDALGSLPADERHTLVSSVIQGLRAYERDGVTDTRATVVLGRGRRPAL